jgi:hypothetical protein
MKIIHTQCGCSHTINEETREVASKFCERHFASFKELSDWQEKKVLSVNVTDDVKTGDRVC